MSCTTGTLSSCGCDSATSSGVPDEMDTGYHGTGHGGHQRWCDCYAYRLPCSCGVARAFHLCAAVVFGPWRVRRRIYWSPTWLHRSRCSLGKGARMMPRLSAHLVVQPTDRASLGWGGNAIPPWCSGTTKTAKRHGRVRAESDDAPLVVGESGGLGGPVRATEQGTGSDDPPRAGRA
jgi:hypothetical protein